MSNDQYLLAAIACGVASLITIVVQAINIVWMKGRIAFLEKGRKSTQEFADDLKKKVVSALDEGHKYAVQRDALQMQLTAITICIWGEPILPRKTADVLNWIHDIRGIAMVLEEEKKKLASAYSRLSNDTHALKAKFNGMQEELQLTRGALRDIQDEYVKVCQEHSKTELIERANVKQLEELTKDSKRLQQQMEESNANWCFLMQNKLGIREAETGYEVWEQVTTGKPVGEGRTLISALEDAQITLKRKSLDIAPVLASEDEIMF